ncbi:MAG: hypothetical protein ABJB86_25275 [Bacteroidota bacterium]
MSLLTLNLLFHPVLIGPPFSSLKKQAAVMKKILLHLVIFLLHHRIADVLPTVAAIPAHIL